jgi:hypothetical protein
MVDSRYPAVRAGHRHAEAFCLMTYATDDGSETERIWNSRGGVTPFYIRSRNGQEMSHINWHEDVYRPDYQPEVGARIFVDYTPEAARNRAERLVEQYWDDPQYPMSRTYLTREEAIAALAQIEPGAPMLVYVDAGDEEDGHATA